jgi:hypothetical protein
MTATANTDKRRVAELLLACFDDDAEKANAVLDAAHREEGGLQRMLAAMSAAVVDLLMQACGGEDGARKTLSLILLDVQVDGGTDD